MSDDRDRYDRPSWSEIDKRRDGSSGRSRDARERRPQGKAAEARARAATSLYLKEADKMFSDAEGGAQGEALAKQARDAHGTSELPAACRAYRDQLGIPSDPSLLSLFLDTGEAELVVAALTALLAAQKAGGLEATPGLKSQIRVLAQDFNDDVAELAEELQEGF